MSAPTKRPGGATAPLLYWLLIVCGLAGLSIQRIDTPAELAPLWIGTVVGVGLGQLVAWLRVRAWVLASIAMCAAWFSPIFLFVLYESIRGPTETCFFAFVPAAICGYLSLSERGGLVAFWYPAVLWMLVILDGPASGAFEARTALPLVIGLSALFIAFLRARETRRVALWQGNATVRLAAPLPRAVLQASPLRAASQVAWTGFVGAAALVLAAWIAPHLWQKEQGKHPHTAATPQATSTMGQGVTEEAQACCPENELVDAKRVRVREYFPLFAGQDAEERRLATTPCTVCRDGKPTTTASNGGSGETSGGGSGVLPGHAYDGTYGGGSGASYGTSSGGGSLPAYAAPTVTPSLPTPPPHVVPTTTPPKPTVAAVVPAAPPKPTTTAVVPPHATPAAPPVASLKPARPVAIVLVPKPAAPPPDPGAPWRSMLAFCAGGLALHVLVRAVRRQLRLRHLARPFWDETLDQRISNHWERMLIGLRDAGIHPAPEEQPEALARRVGIAGMDTCATILERVRHGVRVDESDLATMDAAAGAVYRAARVKAGVSGRAAAWLRWPLA